MSPRATNRPSSQTPVSSVSTVSTPESEEPAETVETAPGWEWAADGLLADRHVQPLIASGIDPDVARERGYRTLATTEELASAGFTGVQALPGLLVPLHGPGGAMTGAQLRPDAPRTRPAGRDGRVREVKYETRRGDGLMLDAHPRIRNALLTPNQPLLIVEGVKKADSAISRGLAAVAISGVTTWRGRNQRDGLTALGDWEDIALADREVFVVFDSDIASNANVRTAGMRLLQFLRSRRAAAQLIQLPASADGSKQGLDDFFASGAQVGDLWEHVTTGGVAVDPRTRYEQRNGAIKMRNARDEMVAITNFTARIISDELHDDGTDSRERYYQLECGLPDRSARVKIRATDLRGDDWVARELGSDAIVYPGPQRMHLSAAIQETSETVERRTVYVCTGWKRFDDGWRYMSASGALGPDGLDTSVAVQLPGALSRFALPEPPTGPEATASVRHLLGLLDLAPDPTTAPLLLSGIRAPLGIAPFTVSLVGPTGRGKTELVGLFQSMYGAGLDAQHLPGSWSSTANALETLAWHLADSMVVVDDFRPASTDRERAEMQEKAERLFRAVGNQAGRGRGTTTGGLQITRTPRSLIVSTGEDYPSGHSLRARMAHIDLSSEINFAALSEMKNMARRGVFASAMSGFISYIAEHKDELDANRENDVARRRDQAASSAVHRRTPDLVAQLRYGADIFRAYMRTLPGIEADEVRAFNRRIKNALEAMLTAQAQFQQNAEPARRFLEYIAEALASGKASLDILDRSQMDREQHIERWGRGGQQIGWADADMVYLSPGQSYDVAVQAARRAGEQLPTRGALPRRLLEEGFLVEPDTSHLTSRVRAGGGQQRVWRIRADVFLDPDRRE